MDDVERLDTGRAFEDGQYARIAQILFDRPFARVTRPAQHLNRGRGDLERGVATAGLDDRQQPLEQGRGIGLRLGIALVIGEIDLVGGGDHKPAQRLDPRRHVEQHALDVGMIVDRDRHRPAPALLALGRILECDIGRTRGDAEPLRTGGEAHVRDHHEHLLQAAPLLADQPGLGALEAERAGGRGMEAHLLLQPAHEDRLARAIDRVGQEEQAQPVRGRGLGEDAMADARREIVIAERDPLLLAADRPAAVVIGHGAGAHAHHV